MTTPLHLGDAMGKDGNPSEGRISDEIRLALGRVEGLVLWRNNISTAMMPNGAYVAFGVGGKGAADLVGIYRGRFVALEIKRPGQKQKPEQLTYEQLVKSKGGEYVVLHSVDEARNWLEEMRRKYP